MPVSSKAIMIARDLADKLASRQPFASGQAALTVSLTFHTDGSPLITMGPGTTLTRTAVIKVIAESISGAKDSLGNTQEAYSPSIIQIAKEANYVGATDNVVDGLKEFDLLQIYGACALYGAKCELWTSTNGTPPSATTFDTASNRIAEFYPQHYRPLQSQT